MNDARQRASRKRVNLPSATKRSYLSLREDRTRELPGREREAKHVADLGVLFMAAAGHLVSRYPHRVGLVFGALEAIRPLQGRGRCRAVVLSRRVLGV